MDSGLGFNTLMTSGSSRVAGKVTDEKEALPEPYSVVVCLEFGSTSSMFAYSVYSHIPNPEKICPHYNYPGLGLPYSRTVTGIYYYSRDGGQSYQVESWGKPARSRYERDERDTGFSSENFFGIYVTRFNPHLKVRDTQISTTKKLKFTYCLPVDRPITDYLHEFGAYILQVLQNSCRGHSTMKMIRWCVLVPSSWDNAAQEKMKTCMESAGLINGADGSPYPVKMVGELEAASLWILKSSELQREVLVGDKLLVVDIGESFFEVVVQEVVSVCNHIHRVKEVSSSLFTRHSSPETEFVRLPHRKIGPRLQGLLTEYLTGHQDMLDQWDSIKLTIGDQRVRELWPGSGEPMELFVPKGLVDILDSYEQKRVRGNEWVSELPGKIKFPYREFESLFDPVIEELVGCISRTYTVLKWVGSGLFFWLETGWHGHHMLWTTSDGDFQVKCQRSLCTRNYDSAASLGAVMLAQDLCNDTSSTS